MYWSRTGSVLDLLLWLLLSGLWWAGGWLLSSYLFNQKPRERLFSGMAIGLFLFILFSNLLGRLLPLPAAFWLAGGLVLLAGLAVAIPAWKKSPSSLAGGRSWLAAAHLWPQVLGFTGMFLLFSLINRGLALFDDYTNLPLVSTLAVGKLPPYFFMDADLTLDYHYGLHLFAASLVRIGGFFPWSAFDVARTLTIVLSLMLGVLWFQRLTRRTALVLGGALLILFGTGTRWLWLFAPNALLQAASKPMQLWGSALQSGETFALALTQPWNIGGSGPFPFPFAFTNGIFRSLSMALGGNGAMPQLTFLLLLLTIGLTPRRLAPRQGGVALAAHLLNGLLLASLALTADHLFVMLYGGFFLAGLAVFGMALFRRQGSALSLSLRRVAPGLAAFLLPGIVLAPVMGGVLTGMTQRWFTRLSGEVATIGFTGAALRWPPAFVSAHLGDLLLSQPLEVLVALAEMGPVLLLAPLSLWLAVRSLRKLSGGFRDDHFNPGEAPDRLSIVAGQIRRLALASLSLAALVGFIAPLFITLDTADRDMSRLAGEAMFIWMVLGSSYLVAGGLFRQTDRPDVQLPPGAGGSSHTVSSRVVGVGRWVAILGFVATILGGIAMFPAQLIAIARPQPTFFVQETDALYSQAYWDCLEPEALVMGFSYPSRTVTIFGRSMGHAYKTYGMPYPEFAALLANPDPVSLAKAGYLYLYAEKREWQDLTPEQRQAFDNPCVRRIPKLFLTMNDSRLFFDLRDCRK